MERYAQKKPQLFTLLAIATILLAGSLTNLTIRILDKQQILDMVRQWKQKTTAGMSCQQLCGSRDVQVNQTCCDSTFSSCSTKQFCFDTQMAVFEQNIEENQMAMIYTTIPGGIAIVFIVVILLFWWRLRRRAAQQLHRNAMEEALLAYQEEHNVQAQDFDDESFESYQEFIQYLLDSGYILPELGLETKKRGDPQITDSFGTVDDENCPICMMEYSEEKVLRLRCEHKFHSRCIRDWNEANPSCPICRADIYSD